jgi:hypothetical protein
VQAVSFMFKDRLSAKDVASVLSRFEQRPDEYGWVVLIGGGREIALEMGGANDGVPASPAVSPIACVPAHAHTPDTVACRRV